jgi:hypothetical protein
LNIKGNKISKDVRFFYRTQYMMKPRLLFEESAQFPYEIALMASFVPTFEPA